MIWDILRYAAFGLFLMVLLPYTVIALWGIGAWTKAIVTGDEPDGGAAPEPAEASTD